MIPESSPMNARRTVPAITVGSIAQELNNRYPQDLPLDLATKLVQQSLLARGYIETSPESAVWSSNREQILAAFEVHYER